ncbi:hypothetical protein CU102_03735 [Phyllobacterium brassicacearum]|uniref:Uncharacterized protein n=1 Tax=Phyllobacterium brassicacearum TaxID=314235 RepID=A0A2P7BUR7_9HYPH|nr:hypothetical protein CU102_03735 [Phyllobacterium brassicacearum]
MLPLLEFTTIMEAVPAEKSAGTRLLNGLIETNDQPGCWLVSAGNFCCVSGERSLSVLAELSFWQASEVPPERATPTAAMAAIRYLFMTNSLSE